MGKRATKGTEAEDALSKRGTPSRGRLKRTATAKHPSHLTSSELFAELVAARDELAAERSEHAAARAELGESLAREAATSEVLNVISRSTYELKPVLNSIVATAARLCHADYANIWRVGSDERYHMVATNNVDAKIAKYMADHPISVSRGTLVGRAVLERKAVHVSDARNDPEYTWSELTEFAKLRTMLGIPLLRNGVPIGVIALHRTVVQPFTEKQIELVRTFTDQAVIAIENVRLFEEVQTRTREATEALERQTATSEVLEVIASSPTNIEPVLQTVATNAARLCGATRFWSLELRVAIWWRQPPAGRCISERQTIVSRCRLAAAR